LDINQHPNQYEPLICRRGIVTVMPAPGIRHELCCRMTSLSYRGHRFPAPIIQHAIWLNIRFTLSYRDVEELLAERGLGLLS
jgi:hypothetical protein